MHLSRLLEINSSKYPVKSALITEGNQVSFSEWDRQADHLAKVMQKKGLKPGDKVVLMMPNVPDFAIVYFSIIRAGGIVVPINVRSTKQEVLYVLEDSRAVGLVAHDFFFPTVSDLPLEFSLLFCTKTGDQSGKWESLDLWKQDTIQEGHWFDYHTLSDNDRISILYTSGSTGRPKGVEFSSRNIITVATMFSIEMEINVTSKLLHLMPLSHSAPLHLMFAAGVLTGATHIMAPTFTPDLLLQLTQTHQITHFFGAPVAYLLSIQHPNFNTFDLSSAKYWIYGGAPLSSKQADLIGQGFSKDKLVCVYGLTEAGPTGTLLRHKDSLDKVGSVGNRGALFTEIEVVEQNNRLCPPGVVGEIRLRSEGTMIGYLNRPEETSKVIHDGWLYTGDMAKYDEQGYIWIVERKKDIIISGGVNVYPKEVEIVLESHPYIQDVAVVGVPHPDWGETVKAYLVVKDDISIQSDIDWLQEIQTYLKSKISNYKIPRIVEVISELPRNSSGKILKQHLRVKS